FAVLTDGYNSQTIAGNIALNFPIATDIQRSALIGTGLMLFVVSLAVNMIARGILGRSERKSRTSPKIGKRV
ncbi:MAG: phosphate ABC transporter permease subunit PstC, partial [Microbacterium sp.]|nr:phosphate ABC transporter permease subunit PstC [Microbacterium sp.]